MTDDPQQVAPWESALTAHELATRAVHERLARVAKLLVTVAGPATDVREGVIVHGPELCPGVDVTQLGCEVQPFQRIHMRLRCPGPSIVSAGALR